MKKITSCYSAQSSQCNSGYKAGNLYIYKKDDKIVIVLCTVDSRPNRCFIGTCLHTDYEYDHIGMVCNTWTSDFTPYTGSITLTQE